MKLIVTPRMMASNPGWQVRIRHKKVRLVDATANWNRGRIEPNWLSLNYAGQRVIDTNP
jgi:hypothetical protein